MIADNSTSGLGGGEPNLDSDDWHVFEADDGELSMSLVYALAELKETDPCDLGFTLADYVDPEALDLLFAGPHASDRHDAAIHLDIDGYEVFINASGRIHVQR